MFRVLIRARSATWGHEPGSGAYLTGQGSGFGEFVGGIAKPIASSGQTAAVAWLGGGIVYLYRL